MLMEILSLGEFLKLILNFFSDALTDLPNLREFSVIN